MFRVPCRSNASSVHRLANVCQGNAMSRSFLNRTYSTALRGLLVSSSELKKAIHSDTPPVILDCSWFMPNVPRNSVAEFKQSRIPGARFFNLDEVTDKSSPYPHMLPSAEDFAKAVGTSTNGAIDHRKPRNITRGTN
jgi:hypothetical protein